MAFEGYKVPYLVKRSGMKSGQAPKLKELEQDEQAEVLRDFENERAVEDILKASESIAPIFLRSKK